jgi:hypothetical protein
MAKVKKHVHIYYSFFCPGCGHNHSYSTEGDNINWKFNGDENNPTFEPSLLSTTMTKNPDTEVYDVVKSICHLFVRNGKIEFLNDCTHEFAGKTVELPNI